ncbi:MAG: zf-HC2 domain-containing protein [Nitrospinae bacterium]|nr:zf-HC2 domain-containing protein [Nitrospinota bacterium]
MLKITCKDTTPLISQMMDRALPWSDRFRVRIHLAICQVCRYYRVQLETLRGLGRRIGREDADALDNAVLSPERKEKIRSLVRK